MSDSTFSKEQFLAIYPQGVEKHYWNLARNMIIGDILSRLSPVGILDVGAGAGTVTTYLRERGFKIWGVEPANVLIPKGLEDSFFVGKTSAEIPGEVKERIDTALFLDVIEHLQDPQGLISEVEKSLSGLKNIVITVPARQELWNNFDEFNGHYLRYDRPQLIGIMKGLGWKPVYCGYFFHGLYWPALLFAKLGLKRSVAIAPPSGRLTPLHRLLARVFYLKYKFLPSYVVGSSIVGVFKKG